MPVVTVFDPRFMPLVVAHLAGLEDFGRLDEIFDLHLLELARAEDEIARSYLVAKRLADLRYAERQLAISRIQNVFEIDEYALRGFGPQISKARFVFDWPNCCAKHQ